jgi:hypothetical protein
LLESILILLVLSAATAAFVPWVFLSHELIELVKELVRLYLAILFVFAGYGKQTAHQR